MEEIYYQGTPVIVLDRKTDSELYTSYVGGDNFEIGKTAGNYVARILKGRGNVIEIWGLPSSSPAIDRNKGFSQILSSYPGLKIVGEINGKWERVFVEEELPHLLRQVKGVDLIYAHNDRMAFGAYQVVKELGLENQVKIIGIDGLAGTNGGIQLVENGILSATFLYPTGGQEAIQIATRILKGEEFQKKNILYSTIIDSSNVSVMNSQYNKILAQRADIKRQETLIEQQAQIYKNQRTLLYILFISFLLTLLLGAWVFKSLKDKQAINRALEIKNTEILEQRNQIQAMAEQTKEANLAKIQFFTNISHEFRTPLTLILGPIEDLLLNEAQGKGKLTRDLRLIKTNAKRLLRLVNQLMDFRKIENQKMQPKWEEREVVSFVEEIVYSFSTLAQKKEIFLEVRKEFPEKKIWFDPNMLDKVLFNLLSNAMKFTPPGGEIKVLIAQVKDDGVATISVTDTGEGIPKDQLGNIFSRYYQGDSSNNLGTGLGLSLSKEFMLLHNGDLTVKSQKGIGSIFTISLPIKKPDFLSDTKMETEGTASIELWTPEIIHSEELFVSSPLKGGASQQILLVEDNLEVREFMKNRLGQKYRILEAMDGQSGLKMAFEKVPDLIICDVALPEMDGISLSQIIKKDIGPLIYR